MLSLTDFLSEDLQVGDPSIFEELDAVDAVEAVVLDHEQRVVDGQAVEDGALPLGEGPLLPPAVLDPHAHHVAGVRGQGVAQLPTAAFPAWNPPPAGCKQYPHHHLNGSCSIS